VRRRGRALEAYALIAGLGLLMIAILVGAGLLFRQLFVGSAIESYYTQVYAPTRLDAATIGAPPSEVRLADVAWYSTDRLLGPVSALRMVAARHGAIVSDAEVSFLMGYTYGSRHVPGPAVYPYADAEAGHAAAAPALGLRRRYYTTDDAALFLQAIGQELERGRPVYLTIDRASLHGGKGPEPHGVLVVGREAGRVYYYETTCAPPAACSAGDRAPGERGTPLADDALLAAVESWARAAQYPWRYGYAVFEPGPRSADPLATLRRNGGLLSGDLQAGPIQGARAVEDVAGLLEAAPGRADVDLLAIAIGSAELARRDSAAYLRAAFPGHVAASIAADQLARAAESYSAALETLRVDPTVSGVTAAARRLREAAAADRAAGEALQAAQ
jgi:hypothetical protein